MVTVAGFIRTSSCARADGRGHGKVHEQNGRGDFPVSARAAGLYVTASEPCSRGELLSVSVRKQRSCKPPSAGASVIPCQLRTSHLPGLWHHDLRDDKFWLKPQHDVRLNACFVRAVSCPPASGRWQERNSTTVSPAKAEDTFAF